MTMNKSQAMFLWEAASFNKGWGRDDCSATAKLIERTLFGDLVEYHFRGRSPSMTINLNANSVAQFLRDWADALETPIDPPDEDKPDPQGI